MNRLSPVRSFLPKTAVTLSCAVLCLLITVGRAGAQRADSARVAPRSAADSARKRTVFTPPLSPRRAFLSSLLLPGYSQSVLGRPTAGALFVVTESIALAMLHESSADLREARRFQTDSLITVGYADGKPVQQPAPFTQRLVDTRRGHVEDWVAFLIANHLFAAADGYVAAHLWDLPKQISIHPRADGAVIAARIAW